MTQPKLPRSSLAPIVTAARAYADADSEDDAAFEAARQRLHDAALKLAEQQAAQRAHRQAQARRGNVPPGSEGSGQP